MDRAQLLDTVASLNTYRSGERRAPHKPLLVLSAIGWWQQGRERLGLEEVSERLRPLLDAWAPPVQGRHQPELPYWHLRSDSIWEVSDAERLTRSRSGLPLIDELRATQAGFSGEVLGLLESDPTLVGAVVDTVLERYFPDTAREEILAACGIDTECLDRAAADAEYVPTLRRRRDPLFRQAVLRAYEHRCAVSGFRASLGGTYFGCEAAHVQWHAYDGPDAVSNGLCLEPTLHKLFDAGAWSLTDDRRVLVSREFTGTEAAVSRLRDLHGKPLQTPLAGEAPLDVRHIQWHREEKLGGVFRLPALPLD